MIRHQGEMALTNTNDNNELRPSTRILTHGFDPTLSVGSARPAVFRSSTYVFSSPEAAERAFDIATGRARTDSDEQAELIYARLNHPNSEILENQIVPLEAGAEGAVVFNSGMAAIVTSLFAILHPGQTVIYTVPAYGGTQHFLRDFLPVWGVEGIAIAAGDHESLIDVILSAHNLGAVLIETPANPTLVMTDIGRVAEAVRSLPTYWEERRPLVLVDNTLLGPVFQHPLERGADLVLYSATKYLSGFSDMLAGVVLAKNKELLDAIRLSRGMFGNILQPDECWLLDGRLSTVGLRMQRASDNAQQIANRLMGNPAITNLFYPTLFEDTEQIEIFELQCSHPGGIISLELHGGKRAAFDFLRNLKIARNAVSLGGVESLACHPKTTTHSGFTEIESGIAGVSDGLVRISIGIEDWRDLLADFEQALET